MNKDIMNNKELTELKKDFDDRVIGETFAGGVFNDNDGQKLYTNGYKDGFNGAKSVAWRWFVSHLKSNDEIKREAVGEFYQKVHDYLDINAEVYMVNSVFEIYENHIFNLTQKENNE